MIEFLLDNSLIIVFFIMAGIILRGKYRSKQKESGLDPKEFRSLLRLRFNVIAGDMIFKLAVSSIITFVISIVSFRELWMNDAFHIIFVSQLLYKPTKSGLKYLVE